MKPDPSTRSGSSIGDMFGAATTSTFLGLPEATVESGARAAIAILGRADSDPLPSVGAYCAGGPAAIRAGIANGRRRATTWIRPRRAMLPEGVTAVDCGDLPIDLEDSAANRRRITAAVATLLDGRRRAGGLGGDDSVRIPLFMLRGSARFTIADRCPIAGATRCRHRARPLQHDVGAQR